MKDGCTRGRSVLTTSYQPIQIPSLPISFLMSMDWITGASLALWLLLGLAKGRRQMGSEDGRRVERRECFSPCQAGCLPLASAGVLVRHYTSLSFQPGGGTTAPRCLAQAHAPSCRGSLNHTQPHLGKTVRGLTSPRSPCPAVPLLPAKTLTDTHTWRPDVSSLQTCTNGEEYAHSLECAQIIYF